MDGIVTAPRIKTGTRLLRVWDGTNHTITVLEEGFEWNGRRFRSLSAIAKAITRTNWNGYAFFGLRPRSRPKPETGRKPGAKTSNDASSFKTVVDRVAGGWFELSDGDAIAQRRGSKRSGNGAALNLSTAANDVLQEPPHG